MLNKKIILESGVLTDVAHARYMFTFAQGIMGKHEFLNGRNCVFHNFRIILLKNTAESILYVAHYGDIRLRLLPLLLQRLICHRCRLCNFSVSIDAGTNGIGTALRFPFISYVRSRNVAISRDQEKSIFFAGSLRI